MKLNINYRLALVYLLILLSAACSKGGPGQIPPDRGSNVALPRNTKNADLDPSLKNDSTLVISVPTDEDFYVGKEKFPLDQLDSQIGKLRQGSNASAPVYLAAGEMIKYDTIVRVLHQIRRQGIREIACMVDQPDDLGSRLRVFKVKIADQLNEKDLRAIKPNPLTLQVSIASDLKLKLNENDIGTVNDTQPLTDWLLKIFKTRKEQYAFAPERANNPNLTLEERVEKMIAIKGDKSLHYGDVIRIVDVVQGTHANPIFLQIDDMFFSPMPKQP
jgi:biopolymer transport protein ExbD